MTTKRELLSIAASFGCKSLLGEQNAKTTKGAKKGYKTGILYMMPNDTLCPMSEIAGCREPCLVTAGRAKFIHTIGKARAGRTEFFQHDRKNFLRLLTKEIDRIISKAKREGLTPVFRLNGTSDIDWSNVKLDNGKNVFEEYPDIQFYDYTKSPSIIRKSANIANWHVTASYSEASPKYQAMISKAANEYGANMAVVFDSKHMPESFNGRHVINGDETDLRFLDDSNVIVGLSAKGDAKQDVSGFVIASDRS